MLHDPTILWSSVGWFYDPDPITCRIRYNMMNYAQALFEPSRKNCGMALRWKIVGWFNEIKNIGMLIILKKLWDNSITLDKIVRWPYNLMK